MITLPPLVFPDSTLNSQGQLFRRQTYPGITAAVPFTVEGDIHEGDFIYVNQKRPDGGWSYITGQEVPADQGKKPFVPVNIPFDRWESMGNTSYLGHIELIYQVQRKDDATQTYSVIATSTSWNASYWPFYAAPDDPEPRGVFLRPYPDGRGSFSDEGGESVIYYQKSLPLVHVCLPFTNPLDGKKIDADLVLWSGNEFDGVRIIPKVDIPLLANKHTIDFYFELTGLEKIELDSYKQVNFAYQYEGHVGGVTQTTTARFIPLDN